MTLLLSSHDLIPNLPYDLARDCFLRLSLLHPRHPLRHVCRQWQALLNSPDFYLERKAQGLSDISVCLIQPLPDLLTPPPAKHAAYGVAVYDPKRKTWDTLPTVPHFQTGLPLFCQCVAVRNSLVLLGGWNPVTWEAMKCVHIFDFMTGRWTKGRDMLGVRSFFACGVMEGIVLVAGGHDDNKNALTTAEVYNVELDEWQALPNMTRERDECKGAVVDGKFYVFSGYATESQGQFVGSADVFDASTRRWELVENMWPLATFPASILSFQGHLLSFHRHELLHYNFSNKIWEVIDSVPDAVRVAPCATIVRDTIFVTGTEGNGNGESSTFLYQPAKGIDGPGKWIFIQQLHGLARGACTLEI